MSDITLKQPLQILFLVYNSSIMQKNIQVCHDERKADNHCSVVYDHSSRS